MLDHTSAAASGDLYGIIAAAGIDYQRFGREADRSDAILELSARVASDDHEAKRQRGGRGGHRVERTTLLPRPEGAYSHAANAIGRRSCRGNNVNCQALVIRPSSLGDIVHALPIVHDLKRHRPGIEIDWVAEEQFTSLVALNRGVRRVIPLALRRWRQSLLVRNTWREFVAFRRELKLVPYDVVIDLQEQLKGALVAWLAQGPVHGPDRASIREPVATVVYRHTHRIDTRQHLIDRCRQLAGKALGYEPSGEPRFDLAPHPEPSPQESRFAVCLHATSRTDKLWPESYWRALMGELARAGMRVLLVSGNDEEAKRSVRLAEGNPAATVLARRELPALAALLARADLVCGVDTGLTHLAAALGTPTIAIFIATDPRLAGVERASKRARDVGGIGSVPTPDEISLIANDLSGGARNNRDPAR